MDRLAEALLGRRYGPHRGRCPPARARQRTRRQQGLRDRRDVVRAAARLPARRSAAQTALLSDGAGDRRSPYGVRPARGPERAVPGRGPGPAVASRGLARAPRHFYGIVSATSLGGGDYERMHRARVGSLRFQVPWPAVQPKRHGPFYWTGPDQIVAQAAKHHIALLPILVGTPAYEAHGCSSCGGHLHIAGKGQRRDWQAF